MADPDEGHSSNVRYKRGEQRSYCDTCEGLATFVLVRLKSQFAHFVQVEK